MRDRGLAVSPEPLRSCFTALTPGDGEPAARVGVDGDGKQEDRTLDHVFDVGRLVHEIETVETLPITSAPSRAAQTVPRPPNRLVPPITAAAIDSSSSVPPLVWVLAACSRAVEIKPPAAARNPARAKTGIRMRVTPMPARRVASA
jgi:hypothetical protein